MAPRGHGIRYLAPLATLLICVSAGAAGSKPLGIPEVQVALSTLKSAHTYRFEGGLPDWMALTDQAVWVDNGPLRAVYRIDPSTDRIAAKVHLPGEPCSGLVSAFGSLWVPICKPSPSIVRVDLESDQITPVAGIEPGDDEGGITASSDSIWIVDKKGLLVRIDPSTNRASGRFPLPTGTFNPLYADGLLWITSGERNQLLIIDPGSGRQVAAVNAGPKPRFLTAGAGSIWTLNQGDGSITRVDSKSHAVQATVQAGISGPGGEICYCQNAVFATVFGIPLTRIDVASNKVTRQWKGTGGDSVRCGFGAIWLTHAYGSRLWRFSLESVSR
jgi:virginiamycin B lyase